MLWMSSMMLDIHSTTRWKLRARARRLARGRHLALRVRVEPADLFGNWPEPQPGVLGGAEVAGREDLELGALDRHRNEDVRAERLHHPDRAGHRARHLDGRRHDVFT